MRRQLAEPSFIKQAWAFLSTPEGQLIFGTIAVLLILFGHFGGIRRFGPLALKFFWNLIVRAPARWLRRRKYPYIKVGGTDLTDEARLRHTHIVGATGSGKTVLIEDVLFRDIGRGYGALIIDPKGDREFYERVRAYCHSVGREKDLHFLSASYPDESVCWNPCRVGSASELQTKFYHSAIYEEPHYAKWCERALLEGFNNLLPRAGNDFTVKDLVRTLETLYSDKRQGAEKIEGLALDLYNLSHGEWGQILDHRAGRKEISLLDITRKNQILFVDLPTEGKKVQSARLGRLLTQELMLISGLRKLRPELKSDRPFSVFIDEFDAFASENFATFLNKGRSSGFMIHIAHQTLSDLRRVSPDFMGQVLGNCNVRFIFRQDIPDDAETWSRFIGTRSVVKTTFQTEDGSKTGVASNREVQEFIVTPNQIKSLRTGRAVVSIKSDGVTRFVKPKYWKLARVQVAPGKMVCAEEQVGHSKGIEVPETNASNRDVRTTDKWRALGLSPGSK